MRWREEWGENGEKHVFDHVRELTDDHGAPLYDVFEGPDGELVMVVEIDRSAKTDEVRWNFPAQYKYDVPFCTCSSK